MFKVVSQVWEYKDIQFKNCFILITVNRSEHREWLIVGLSYDLMNQISPSPKEPYGLVGKKQNDPKRDRVLWNHTEDKDKRVFVPAEV